MKLNEDTLKCLLQKNIISISLNHYVYVFNELDSALLAKKNIDHDLRHLLEDRQPTSPKVQHHSAV
jgi:hypothetical protein